MKAENNNDNKTCIRLGAKTKCSAEMPSIPLDLPHLLHWRIEGGGAKGALPPPPLKLVKV